MEDDLNVENLLETRAERAPRTEAAWGRSAHRDKPSFSAGVAVFAALTALAILFFSGRSGRRHVLERY
jgi:hypothetical protein